MSEQRINIQTIENKQFDIKPRGYDREAVDTFLDDICDEIERMNNEAAALRQQLREAQAAASRAQQEAQAARSAAAAQPAPQPVAAPVAAEPQAAGSNADVMAMLELATRLKNETLADAQKQAEKILADANEQARAHMGSLAEERDSLTNQVEALRQTVADYRERFVSLLQAQQDALDKISDL